MLQRNLPVTKSNDHLESQQITCWKFGSITVANVDANSRKTYYALHNMAQVNNSCKTGL